MAGNTHQDRTHKKTGSMMYAAAALLVLGLFYVVFDSVLQYQNNPNGKVTGSDRITLSANRYGHYLMTGMINGNDVDFLIDTGATGVAVPAHIAERIGLIPSGEKAESVQTAGGIVSVFPTRLATLTIGEMQLHDVRAHINPSMYGDEVLLGMRVLRHFRLQQSGNVLIIEPQIQ